MRVSELRIHLSLSFAHHVYNICAGCALLTRLSSIHVLQMSRTYSVGPWVIIGQYCT
jgi:hypothetical protein